MNTRKLTAGVVTNLATLTPFALNSLNKNKKIRAKLKKLKKCRIDLMIAEQDQMLFLLHE